MSAIVVSCTSNFFARLLPLPSFFLVCSGICHPKAVSSDDVSSSEAIRSRDVRNPRDRFFIIDAHPFSEQDSRQLLNGSSPPRRRGAAEVSQRFFSALPLCSRRLGGESGSPSREGQTSRDF